MKKLKTGRLGRSIIFSMLIILLLSCCVVGVFARYQTEITGTGLLQIAKFDISVDDLESPTEFTLLKGAEVASVDYSFSVTSDSEVSVSYDVVLTLSDALPNGLSFKIGDLEPTSEGLTYTFLNVGEFSASDGLKTNTHTLTITASVFDANVSLDSVNVKVVASQIAPVI